MSERESVTVVIPALNAQATIRRQLEALDAQVGAPDFEIVVADNGSADATRSVVVRTQLGPPVRVVDASQRKGAAWARNVGAEAAHGSLLLFCDADDVVDTQWVSELCAASRAFPGALLAGNVLHERLNPLPISRAYTHRSDDETRRLALQAPRFSPSETAFAGLLPTIPGNSFGIPRNQFKSLGGMRLTFGAEDTEFAWRAQLAGIPVVSVPRAFTNYQLKDSMTSIYRQQRLQHRERIRLWVHYRHLGMTGPSFRYSLREFFRHVAVLALGTGSPEERFRAAWLCGAHAGALEGMGRYRVLPQLGEVFRGRRKLSVR